MEPCQTFIFNLPAGQAVDVQALALSRQHDYRLVSVSRCPIVSGRSYQLEFERVTKYIPPRPKPKSIFEKFVESLR